MDQWDAVRRGLDRDAATPLYEQVAEHIASSISSGEMVAGTKLPASRELARMLRVNRATISNAYEALAKRGLVRSHVGQGTFVMDRVEAPMPSSMAWSFSRAMDARARTARWVAPQTDHPRPVDFSALVPDEELFPVEPFRKALDEVLKRQGKELLQYGPPAGYPPLRDYIAERLGQRGVTTSPENVLIVNGSQQGLDLVCRAFLDPGDVVAVEGPTYHVVPPLLALYQAQLASVPMTPRGMDLDVLDRLLSRRTIKLIYTMPTFHNPTGITMDRNSRQALLELARRHQVPVVEDDYDSELRFGGQAVPSLKALDDAGTVVHLGTFSKGLFPGLRLGWIVATREVSEPLGRAKLFSDYHTSPLLQAAVLEFCRQGHYDAHLRHLARIYREKSQRLTTSLEKHFPPEVSWTEPQGGYAYWITLPEGVSSETLQGESHRVGVFFTPGSHFFTGNEGERYLRLSISRVPLDLIEEGVARLGALIRDRIGRRKSSPAAFSDEPVFHI